MKALIEIDCETISELNAHLKELQKQIKKQAKINKAHSQKDDFAVGTFLYDDNCYGTHQMDVVEELS